MTVENVIESQLREQFENIDSSSKLLVCVTLKVPEGLIRSDGRTRVPQEVIDHNRTVKQSYSQNIMEDVRRLGINIKINPQTLVGLGTLTKDETYRLAERPYVTQINGEKVIGAAMS